MNNSASDSEAWPDLRQRIKDLVASGQPDAVETLLTEHLDLRSQEQLLLDCIYAEFCFREEHNQAPQPAEYLKRFPVYTKQLQALFEVHAALDTPSLLGAETRVNRKSSDGQLEDAATLFAIQSNDPQTSEANRSSSGQASAFEQSQQIAGGRVGGVSLAKAISLRKFVRQLEDSGIIDSDTLKDFIPPKKTPEGARDLARDLVQQKKLTRFQAEEVYKGNAKALVLGNYVLMKKIGAGGMGQVFKAHHRRMDRIVALKILSPTVIKTPKVVQRFQREVKAAAKLEHPNIVTAHDADEANGTHFFVMQYVDGYDLSSIIKSHGPMTVPRAVHCLDQAARGLQYAHERGIVHRDIKPANLLLSNDDQLKILDLGLATMADNEGVVDHGLTGTGAIIGTVDYMAPEQGVNTKQADARSDIYSLGCTFYYLLTGKAPFSGETAVEKILAHRDQPIPDLGKQLPDLPAPLLRMFQRMVAKEPANRYQTMGELLAALRAVNGASSAIIPPASKSPSFDPALQKFFDSKGGTVVDKGVVVQTESVVRTPPADTLKTATVHTDSYLKLRQTRTQTVRAPAAGKPRENTHRWLMAAGGGLGGLLLFGIIIITITNKDGKKSTIKVPEGVETNVNAALGAKVDIVQQDDVPKPSGSISSTNGWHGWPTDAPPPAIAPFNAEQAKQHQEAWAKYLKAPVEYTNSIGMKFRLVPPGEFMMGSTADEIEQTLKSTGDTDFRWEHVKSETPQHKVILTQPIYLGVSEVTQAEYDKVMGANPSYFTQTGGGKGAVAGMDTTNHPVETVSWNDAAEFCSKLSNQEELKPFYFRAGETITPLDGTGYRLPTEAEWENACRAGTTTKFWIGDKDEDLMRAGWFRTNSGDRTHAVGELRANPYGLFDVHGNLWEWVQDCWNPTYYGEFTESPAVNPSGPYYAGSQRVMRDGRWDHDASHCRAGSRYGVGQGWRAHVFGFRVSLQVDAVRQALKIAGPSIPHPQAVELSDTSTAGPKPSTSADAVVPDVTNSGWHGWPADAPQPTIAPFNADEAKNHQEAWAKYLNINVEYTNSIGMKFRLIPPGEFTMGSALEEIEQTLKFIHPNHEYYKRWQDCVRSEAPQHKVILTLPIYLGVNEVTQAQYEKVMGVNPSHFALIGEGKKAVAGLDTGSHPVETVSWNDAAEFCLKLSEQEELKPFYFRAGETITPLDGTGYRLPTEAEWENACRAGTTTKYWIGDEADELLRAGWFGTSSGGRSHAVGELKANAYGLFDTHGNVWEYVEDWWGPKYFEELQKKPAVDPIAPSSESHRHLIRGGCWIDHASRCRAAHRDACYPAGSSIFTGFRVSLVIRSVVPSPTTEPSVITAPSTGSP